MGGEGRGWGLGEGAKGRGEGKEGGKEGVGRGKKIIKSGKQGVATGQKEPGTKADRHCSPPRCEWWPVGECGLQAGVQMSVFGDCRRLVAWCRYVGDFAPVDGQRIDERVFLMYFLLFLFFFGFWSPCTNLLTAWIVWRGVRRQASAKATSRKQSSQKERQARPCHTRFLYVCVSLSV